MFKDVKFYVYHIYGVDNELLYVGKGSGDRYLSHLKGTSSNRFVNEYFFSNGQDGCLTSKIVETFSNQTDAFNRESFDINQLKPLFNQISPRSKDRKARDSKLLKLGAKVDYIRTMKDYIKAIEENNTTTRLNIEISSPDHKLHLDKLGVDKIKGIGWNKTKIVKAYTNKVVFEKTYSEVKYLLKGIRIGGRYTSSDITSKLQDIYIMI